MTNWILHTQNLRYQITQLFWNLVKIPLIHKDLLVQRTTWYISRRSVMLVSIELILLRKIVKGIEIMLQFQIVLNGLINLKMVRRIMKVKYLVRSIHNANMDRNWQKKYLVNFYQNANQNKYLLIKLTAKHYQSAH